MTTPSTAPPPEPVPRPWWRYGFVWLVVGGPAVVVVASLVTGFVAWYGADEVLIDTPSARHVATTRPGAQTPALAARNHAATPADP